MELPLAPQECLPPAGQRCFTEVLSCLSGIWNSPLLSHLTNTVILVFGYDSVTPSKSQRTVFRRKFNILEAIGESCLAWGKPEKWKVGWMKKTRQWVSNCWLECLSNVMVLRVTTVVYGIVETELQLSVSTSRLQWQSRWDAGEQVHMNLLLCPVPVRWGIMRWWPLSVCLSIPYVILSWEQKGIGSWKMAGRKPMTRVTCDPL